MTRDFPDNPFVPGFGELPSVMGRRPEVDQVLEDVVRLLARPKKPNPGALYLYGPRGAGKTVHIRDFKARLRQGSATFNLINLAADMVQTPEAMIRTLLDSPYEFAGGKRTDGTPSPSLHMNLEAPEEYNISSGRSLQRLAGPLLITLDEAHRVEPAALGILLNAVQDAGETKPTVLMLGGTPDLIDQLRDCGASFWDRGRSLPLRPLDATSATDVLAVPFSQAGITVDGPTLDELVAATDRYPWFLQLYGHEAYKAVQETDARHLGPEVGRQARQRAGLLRRQHYTRLRREFRTPEQIRAALATAQALQEHDGVMQAPRLEGMLAAFDADEFGQTERHMRHVGLIVEGAEPDTIEPGLPGFMEYLLRVLTPNPPAPSPREAEGTKPGGKDEFQP